MHLGNEDISSTSQACLGLSEFQEGPVSETASLYILPEPTNSNTGAYCASKGASLNLTKQLAIDYARDRIHCNALCPGCQFPQASLCLSIWLIKHLVTKTSMTRGNWEDEEVDKQMKSMTPWGEWGNPDDVAKAAVFLASDDAAWVTGVGLPVDGGYLAQ